MSTPFQNRLVGTVIVAAVAIIFLPDILDGEKKTYQEEFDKIPAPPKVEFQPSNKQLDANTFEKLSKETIAEDIADDDQMAAEEQLDDVNHSVDDESSVNTNSDQAIKVNTLAKEETIKSLAEESAQPAQETKLPEKSVPKQAWVIQLGTFRHEKNVAELMKKLTKNGYTTFSKPIKTRNGTLTKVFVGPELIKSSLEKKIPELKQLTNVQGKIARFTPTK